MEDTRIYQMRFSKIYQLLIDKADRKGRTKNEVDEIIRWLTGYCQTELDQLAEGESTYAAFFEGAPAMNPHRKLIKGTVCGVRVEAIQQPLMQEIRYLDKLIDELAKGKALDRILRAEQRID